MSTKRNQTQQEQPPAGQASDATDKAAEEEALMAQLEAEEAAKNAQAADAKPKVGVEKTSLYHVAPGNNLWLRGGSHGSLESIELTEQEARELGDMVRPGKYVAPVVDVVAERQSGTYRVAKDGGMLCLSRENKRFHVYPDVLELSAEEARELGAVVERV